MIQTIIPRKDVELDKQSINDYITYIINILNIISKEERKEECIKSIANIISNIDEDKKLRNLEDLSNGNDILYQDIANNEEFYKTLLKDDYNIKQSYDTRIKAKLIGCSVDAINSIMDGNIKENIKKLEKIYAIYYYYLNKVSGIFTTDETHNNILEVVEDKENKIYDFIITKIEGADGKTLDKLEEKNQESLKNCLKDRILDINVISAINKETDNFANTIKFNKLEKILGLSGVDYKLDSSIRKTLLGEEYILEKSLQKVSGLDYSSKTRKQQELIQTIARAGKFLNNDEMLFNEKYYKLFINLVKNIPDVDKEAEKYTNNVKKIINKYSLDVLNNIYGDNSSKPLSVKIVTNLAKNIDSKSQIDVVSLYNKNKTLFKHLIQKEKTIQDIKETSEALDKIICGGNVKLLQDICENDKVEEVIKLCDIGEKIGLTDLKLVNIKDEIEGKTTWKEAEAAIVSLIIDKKLEALRSSDKNFLEDKEKNKVYGVLKDEVLKNKQLYETIINEPKTIKKIKTFTDFYTKLTPSNTEVSEQVLQNVVLTEDQLKNPLITNNLNYLTKCVNSDLTIKKNSILNIISVFNEAMIQDMDEIKINEDEEEVVTITQALQNIVTHVIEKNPNSVSKTFKEQMNQIKKSLTKYKKDKEDSNEEGQKREVSKIIKYIEMLQNTDVSRNKNTELRDFIYDKEIELLEDATFLPEAGSIFSLSDTDSIYNSIIDKKSKINDDLSRIYALKLAALCNNEHDKIINTYHDFLEKSNESSIGDDKSSKEAIVSVIVSACQENTELFTKIMTGDGFTEEDKIDLIKRKYLPQRFKVTETKRPQQIYVSAENIVKDIFQDYKQISEKTITSKDIFVKGVNEALEKYYEPDAIVEICKLIEDEIVIETETLKSLNTTNGQLLSEISARQTAILDDKSNNDIIDKLIEIDKEVYGGSAKKDDYIPSIYHFIETIQDSNIKKEQSKKIADKIISKLTSEDIGAGRVLDILSGCKKAGEDENKPIYNAIIDGLASQANDNNIECIRDIISSCLDSKDEKEQDIAVDLYHKISQKQSNNLQKNNFSESNLSKLLLETPLRVYIEQNKKEKYEIITGSLLVEKQKRSVEDILGKLKLSPKQVGVYKEQIALLSTPEEVFDLLNGLIKNHNTNVASGLASEHVDLLTSGDRDNIRGEFKKHVLKELFMSKSFKTKGQKRGKLYEELEERASQAGFTEKHEIRGLVKKLERKEKEFVKAREELTKFAELHIKRAREAAEYIAKYNKFNEIINNKEKYGEEERKNARLGRKLLAKGHYDFMNHAHGWGRAWRKNKNPIQFIWSIFSRKSARKLYYAKKELEKSNKALRVVIGVDFVPEHDSKKGTEYTIRTNIEPNPNETTIKSKKLRMIKQHEDAGFWERLLGGGKARYSRLHKLRVHRDGEATAMEGFTEKFIKETSDLRKEAVEILTKKSYYSESSLGKVKTSDKKDRNFIYDAAFGTNKDQENGDKGKGRS